MNDSASTLEAAVDESNEAEFLRKVQLALAPVEDINDIGNDDSSISLDEAEAQFRRNAWAALAPLYETETMSNSNGNVIIDVNDEGGNMKIMGGESKKKAAPLYETETSITKCSAMMKASDGRGSISIIGEELEKKTDYYGTMEASVADVYMHGGQLASRKQEKWYADHEAYQGKAEHAVQAATSTGDGCKNGGYKTLLGNTKYKSHPHPTKEGKQDFALRTRLPNGTRLSPYNEASYPSASVGHLMRGYNEHEALSYPKKDEKDRTNIICKEIRLKSKPSKKNGIVSQRNYPINCYNAMSAYNLYYILERELFLKNNGAPPAVKFTSRSERMYYGDLASAFPPLPSRYESLELPDFWFLRRTHPQRNRYKKYRDSNSVSLHGLTSAIAKSWKSCDASVKDYVRAVAKIITKRTHSKNSTNSLASNPSRESSLLDTHPKFESKAQGQRVSSEIEHVPHVVNNWMQQQQQQQQRQQQLAKLYCTYPSFYQQRIMLEYAKTELINAELNRHLKEVIALCEPNE